MPERVSGADVTAHLVIQTQQQRQQHPRGGASRPGGQTASAAAEQSASVLDLQSDQHGYEETAMAAERAQQQHEIAMPPAPAPRKRQRTAVTVDGHERAADADSAATAFEAAKGLVENPLQPPSKRLRAPVASGLPSSAVVPRAPQQQQHAASNTTTTPLPAVHYCSGAPAPLAAAGYSRFLLNQQQQHTRMPGSSSRTLPGPGTPSLRQEQGQLQPSTAAEGAVVQITQPAPCNAPGFQEVGAAGGSTSTAAAPAEEENSSCGEACGGNGAAAGDLFAKLCGLATSDDGGGGGGGGGGDVASAAAPTAAPPRAPPPFFSISQLLGSKLLTPSPATATHPPASAQPPARVAPPSPFPPEQQQQQQQQQQQRQQQRVLPGMGAASPARLRAGARCTPAPLSHWGQQPQTAGSATKRPAGGGALSLFSAAMGGSGAAVAPAGASPSLSSALGTTASRAPRNPISAALSKLPPPVWSPQATARGGSAAAAASSSAMAAANLQRFAFLKPGASPQNSATEGHHHQAPAAVRPLLSAIQQGQRTNSNKTSSAAATYRSSWQHHYKGSSGVGGPPPPLQQLAGHQGLQTPAGGALQQRARAPTPTDWSAFVDQSAEQDGGAVGAKQQWPAVAVAAGKGQWSTASAFVPPMADQENVWGAGAAAGLQQQRDSRGSKRQPLVGIKVQQGRQEGQGGGAGGGPRVGELVKGGGASREAAAAAGAGGFDMDSVFSFLV